MICPTCSGNLDMYAGNCPNCDMARLLEVQFASLQRIREQLPPARRNVKLDAKREVEISLLNLWMALPSADWGERYEYRTGTL